MKREITPLAALLTTAGPLPAVPEVSPDRQAPPRRSSGKFASQVHLNDLRAAFAAGPLSKAEAVAALVKQTGCSRSAAYNLLTQRFAVFLCLGADGRLTFAE